MGDTGDGVTITSSTLGVDEAGDKFTLTQVGKKAVKKLRLWQPKSDYEAGDQHKI